MTEPPDYESLFREHLPLIDRLLAAVARRYGLHGADAEEYASLARMRLWENDWGVLRKWRGDSKLSTYLAVVLTNLAHEYRIRRDGRWRASAAGERLGPTAVLLEKLVHHYGMRLDEAGEWLRTRGGTSLSDRELAALLAQLPVRTPGPRVTEPEPPADRLPDDRHADDPLLATEAAAEWRGVRRALDEAIGTLSPLEQNVVRMHFLEGHTLADVARALGAEQKPLYRTKDAALRKLRRALEERGVGAEQLRELLGGALPPPDDLAEEGGMVGAPGKSGGARPSNETWNLNQPDETRLAADAGPFGRTEE